jgi:Fe-S cluster assembly iron-binding protein IscA
MKPVFLNKTLFYLLLIFLASYHSFSARAQVQERVRNVLIAGLEKNLLQGLIWHIEMPQVTQQGPASENEVKAVFIYNFTKYIDWKQNASGQFVIMVIGDSPVIPALKEIAKRNKVKNMRIVVVTVGSPEHISNANIVFVPETERDQLRSVLAKTASGNILVISETEGSAHSGSGINFVNEDNRVKFEINNNSLKRHGLQASSQLLKLAITVIE